MLKKLVISSLFLSVACLAVDTSPEVVDVSLKRAYVPLGFDSNDKTQIVVVGTFPDTCYKVGPTEVNVDPVRKLIEVRQSAYHYSGICLPIIDPFDQVITLGILNAGNYAITDAVSQQRLGSIPVTLATKSEPDDYLYMPIADAYTQYDKTKSQTQLTITGKFTDRCTRYLKTLVNYYQDVIVVQPIAERLVPHSWGCDPVHTRFSVSVPLRQGLTGTHLLHVRSMNGQAINKLVDLE